jgi:hypothetical protein
MNAHRGDAEAQGVQARLVEPAKFANAKEREKPVFNNSLANGAFLWHYQVDSASRAPNYFPVLEDMIMRRWALAWLLLIVVLAAPAIAQVQTVGDVSFAVPEGWTYQGSADGGLMLLKQGTNFWIVTVHAPRPTSGNPNADFKSTWQAVVSSVPQFSRSLPGYDPYSISNKAVGYPGKYYDAHSDDGQMYIRLYTLETGKLVIPVMVLTPNRQVLDSLEHIVDAVVGSVRVAPLKASPIRNTLTMADLVGEWHTGMTSSRTYYDRYSGAYAGSSTTAYSAAYHVAGNGTFTYEMGGLWNNRPVQDKDTGVVELSGDLVTFKGRGHTTRYHFVNLQTAIDGSTVITLLPGQEDPAKANVTALQQQLVREGKK